MRGEYLSKVGVQWIAGIYICLSNGDRMQVFGSSLSSTFEGDRESTRSEVLDRVRRISACLTSERDRSVFVYAMGAQRRKDILQLEDLPGVEVVWARSLIPGWIAPARLLIASYAALIRVTDMSNLRRVFETAIERSMGAIYVIRKEQEQDFIDKTREPKSSGTYDFGAKRDPRYLIYMVDADNWESSTGIYEIASMGYMNSDCIKECFGSF